MATSETRIPEAGARHASVLAAAPAVSDPTIADPAPLGLAAFAMTTFVLSVFNANIIKAPSPLEVVVLPLALFYGGLVQLLAGMWEFKKANTFGATAFSSYGAFWLSFAAYVKFIAPGLPAATAHQATGLYLLGWSIFTGYMFVASLRTNSYVAAVFLFLFLTFLFLAWGALAQKTGITHLGGWLGLVTAVLAWSGSFVAVVNSTFKRAVLPAMSLAPRT